MDPRERFNNLSVALLAALQGWQAGIWTAFPGIVESFDPAAETCTVRPAVQARLQDPVGRFSWATISTLVDVPVVFPGGGGWTLTFPITPGDEALIVISKQCIDGWWQSGAAGGSVVPPDLRMHNLSDGFAIVGPRSKPRALSGVKTDCAQLRSDDGLDYVQVGPGSLVRAQADRVKAHARISWSWDVNGYGQEVIWTGGNTWTINNYVTGAIVTTNNLAINPPEAPPP